MRLTKSSTTSTPASTDTPVPPLTIYPRVGKPRASTIRPKGPALALMGGGGEVPSAFRFMHDAVAGSRSGRAVDIIVLRASGDNDYDSDLMKFAPFNSVQTIVMGRGARVPEFAKASAIIERAQAVVIAGGDQANYVRWRGTPVISAVQGVYDRGGAVGGTSAGLAVLGEYAFDSVAADAAGDDVEVMTKNAVTDPVEPIISFTHNLFSFPSLRGIITDTHFAARDRLGRLTVFLARLAPVAHHEIMGVGINERTALLIDKNGIGTLAMQGKGGLALFVRGGRGARIVPGEPFVARGFDLTLLNRPGQRYDFNRWCASALTYPLKVDGRKSPIYAPGDPYHAPANAKHTTCDKQAPR